VVDNDDINALLSLRNLDRARVITAAEANTYDLVDNTCLLFTKPALEWLEGVLS
jgi:ribosomal protein L4